MLLLCFSYPKVQSNTSRFILTLILHATVNWQLHTTVLCYVVLLYGLIATDGFGCIVLLMQIKLLLLVVYLFIHSHLFACHSSPYVSPSKSISIANLCLWREELLWSLHWFQCSNHVLQCWLLWPALFIRAGNATINSKCNRCQIVFLWKWHQRKLS